MILVSTLYDEYIDRPKLTEQKKKPVEYIVPPPPPPPRGVGTKIPSLYIYVLIFQRKKSKIVDQNISKIC